MIKIIHLSKQFEEVKAVDNISLDIGQGIYGLVGHNGAGKSTLLRLIAGVYQKSEGQILIDNVESDSLEGKKKVFFLSDDPYCEASSNVKQVFDFYSTLFELDEKRFQTLIQEFGLPVDRRVSNFSKGMRRQLFVSIALSSAASVLLLDEAFDGLDPLAVQMIKDEILSHAGKKTVIISSHNIASLQRLCDHFILLSKGHFQSEGTGEDMGHTFLKLQIIFSGKVDQVKLDSIGLDIVTFKKVGSIYQMVCLNENAIEILQKEFKPTLVEPIAIEPDELIALEMALAKRGM